MTPEEDQTASLWIIVAFVGGLIAGTMLHRTVSHYFSKPEDSHSPDVALALSGPQAAMTYTWLKRREQGDITAPLPVLVNPYGYTQTHSIMDAGGGCYFAIPIPPRPLTQSTAEIEDVPEAVVHEIPHKSESV